MAAYQIVGRSTLKRGKELYPAGSPGLTGANLAPYSLNPGVEMAANGDIVAAVGRLLGHDVAGTVGTLMRSSNGGRSWPHVRDEQVVWNPDPTRRCMIETARRLRSGRIVFTAFTDSLASSVIPYLLYSDDHGATVKSPIALPIPEASNFCRYHRPFENPAEPGRLYAPCYFYRNNSWKLSQLYYTDDPTLTSGWTLKGTIADKGNGTERKEPYVDVLPDGRFFCLTRGDDVEQITRGQYSSDNGATWGAEFNAFSAYNQPYWIYVPGTGDLLAFSRGPGVQPLGDQIYNVSSDLGATWGSNQSLVDPTQTAYTVGVGAAPVLLGPNKVGVISAVARGDLPFGVARLEFVVLDASPASSGEFANYSLDPCFSGTHPAKIVSNSFGWYHMESLRSELQVGANVTRWRNGLGIPGRDLVWSGLESVAVLQDGPDFSTGLVGGPGCVQNHGQGGGNFQLDKPETLAQPVLITAVFDASVASTGYLFDDGNGIALRWVTDHWVLSMTGSTAVNFAGPWTAGPGVISLVLDGANTRLRLDGVDLTISSGGPLGSRTLNTVRVNGPGNSGWFSDLREIVVAQTNNLTEIAALEAMLLAKHRVLS